MASIDPKLNRKLLKSAVGARYARINAALQIAAEETRAPETTAAVKALVDAEGPGPHRFSEKNEKGEIAYFWLTFRKGKGETAYTIKRKDDAAEDDATPVDDATQPS